MSQRRLCALLLLFLLALCPPALATVQIAVEYEGAYVPIPGHNIALYLPGDWLLYETGDALLHAAAPSGDPALTVRAFENTGGFTMDTLLTSLEQDRAYEAVAPVFYGGVPFIEYTAPEGGSLGAATLSGDGRFLYFFAFSPLEAEGLHALMRQIMSTVLTQT